MKREITCPQCVERWRALVGKYPGEEIKIVEGSARKAFVCDGCACPLPKGTTVYAMSLYTQRTPYFPWEDDFIAQKPTQAAKDNDAKE